MIARRTCIGMLFVFMVSPALGQTAGMLGFQGLIKDDQGVPLEGSVNLDFRVFDALVGGLQVDITGDGNVDAADTKQAFAVPVAAGLFSTKFGPISPATFDGNDRFLEVSVDGDAMSRIEMVTAVAVSERVNKPGTGLAAVSIDASSNDDLVLETPFAELRLDAASSQVIFSAPTASRGGVTPILKFDLSTGTISSVGSLSFQTGGFARGGGTRMTIDAAGDISFTGSMTVSGIEGISSDKMTISSGARGAGGAELTLNIDGDLELRVDGEIVDRWTGPGDAGGGLGPSPNRISGSFANTVTVGRFGVVIAGGGLGGGQENTVDGMFSTIGGGYANTVNGGPDAYASTISGGNFNTASFTLATIGGGSANMAVANATTIGGGHHNTASAINSTIGGGSSNIADGENSTIAGGDSNIVTDDHSCVAGGSNNRAGDNAGTTDDATHAAVGGGKSNTAGATFSTVGGGVNNIASATCSTVGGGGSNTADGEESTIGGGRSNTASGEVASVGGGTGNKAIGKGSFVGGGFNNTASGAFWATVPGGNDNVASGESSLAAGGFCVASGNSSFATGSFANASNAGMFVWADRDLNVFPASTESNFTPAANQFLARTRGGAVFVTAIDGSGNSTAGVELASGGGSWSSLSDRNAKENLAPVNGRDALEKVATMPISTWNYKSQDPSIRHIGPMAQDVFGAFGVGEKATMITTIDADGIALAAIQGLHELIQEKDCEIAELDSRNDELEFRNDDLEIRLARLEQIVAQMTTREGGAR